MLLIVIRSQLKNYYPLARYEYAKCLKNGKGIVQSEKEAFHYFNKCYENLNSDKSLSEGEYNLCENVCNNLANCYYNGFGTEQSDEKAMFFLEKSLEIMK